jgi:ribosomal protein S18 acetylase RimI-like enzyme
MVSEITLNEQSMAETIHALAQAAYSVEAKQTGCTDFPPLRETVEQLRASSDRFLIFCESENIRAVLSFVCEGDCVTITRLAVSSTQFRQGIAKTLITELEKRVPLAASLVVSTAEANVPAVTLYQNFGYTIARTSQSREGIALVHFQKLKTAAKAR